GPQKSFIVPGKNPVSSALHLARTVVRRGERRIVEYTHKDPEDLKITTPLEYEVLSFLNIERLVAVPLERDGELYACIGVDNPPPELMQNAVSILQTLRYFLMLAIRRTEDEAELTKLSYYDNLTSFYNRNRYIQDLEAFTDCEDSVGIVFLDMNGLKSVND
ncbi:hypothetical protein NE464_21215, partial [Eubacterium callanderi]|nr:hypothetical protein [Eubacterium callanderi]